MSTSLGATTTRACLVLQLSLKSNGFIKINLQSIMPTYHDKILKEESVDCSRYVADFIALQLKLVTDQDLSSDLQGNYLLSCGSS